MRVTKTRPAASEDAPANDVPAPRRPTFTENLILTVKVLAAFGLLGAALWAANLWTAAR